VNDGTLSLSKVVGAGTAVAGPFDAVDVFGELDRALETPDVLVDLVRRDVQGGARFDGVHAGGGSGSPKSLGVPAVSYGRA
jgi:hypothetical protein